MSAPIKITLRSPLDAAIRNLQTWVDSVTAVLCAGFRFGDQVAPLITTTWTATAPTAFQVPNTTAPMAVMCLSAIKSSAPDVLSCGPVRWTYSASGGHGSILISAIGGIDGSDANAYTLTLCIIEG